MATFKAEVQKHHKKSDGTYNIKIRVTHKQKKRYLPTPYFVVQSDLTRALKIKTQSFKDSCEDIERKYRDICNRHGNAVEQMDVDEIVELIKNDSREEIIDFIGFGRRYAEKLISSGRKGSGDNYKIALNSLVKFIGKDMLAVSEITSKFLSNYVAWLVPDGNTGERKVSLYLTMIRALHNKIKEEYNNEDIGIIKIPYSPFVKFKVPKPKTTKKRALTIQDIQKIIDTPYVESPRAGNNRFNLAKDLFILSFGLVGMNSIDLYNCTEYKDGHITYCRTKTKTRRDDEALISIAIEPQIASIFEKYRDLTGKRVFNFYQQYTDRSTFNAAINKGLKELGKALQIDTLQYYAARHSWATIALNDCGVDKYTVHTALNHVDTDMKVTDIYIKKDFTIIAEANRKVLSKFQF